MPRNQNSSALRISPTHLRTGNRTLESDALSLSLFPYSLPTGQLLTVSTAMGDVLSYLVSLPTVHASSGPRVAYLSQLTQASIVDARELSTNEPEGRAVPVLVELEPEPEFLALGGDHLAASLNNKASAGAGGCSAGNQGRGGGSDWKEERVSLVCCYLPALPCRDPAARSPHPSPAPVPCRSGTIGCLTRWALLLPCWACGTLSGRSVRWPSTATMPRC